MFLDNGQRDIIFGQSPQIQSDAQCGIVARPLIIRQGLGSPTRRADL